MSEVVRLSFSIEPELARQLERLVRDSTYTNRSEYIRDLIRQRLVDQQWQRDAADVLGTLTLLYDHHQRRLGEKLVDIQHDHHDLVLATTHVHLSHDLCAEVVILRGPAARLRRLADLLRQQKGVLHAALGISSTGRALH